MRHFIPPLMRKVASSLFYVEKTSVTRRRIGKLAGRRVVSEQRHRRRVLEWEHVLIAVFLIFVGQELAANYMSGGSGVLCLLEGQPLFCELTPTPIDIPA